MSSVIQNSSRRNFLQKAGLCALFVAPLMSSLKGVADGVGGLVMVPETDPQAISLGYVTDASRVDNVKWPKHASAEGAKQYCYNCQFYQFSGTDPKSSSAAPCQILGNRGVTAKGWCNTWVQNPKVTT
jgi:hypothetical protein